MGFNQKIKKRKRKRTHGFLKRNPKILERRRKKGRWRIAP